MTKRTYIPSLMDFSTEMCKLVSKATPVVSTLYPTNAALLAALAAANAACQTLAEETAKVREYGD